ncbi:MAG: hypothetical protein KDD14_10060 [Saprospiraceae bacterium]|nr:hypothetical protein [Saprospiraceae bacterium]
MRYGILFCFLLYTALASGQERLVIQNSCSFGSEGPQTEYYTFEASEEALRIVSDIVNSVGLTQNFTIRSADCKNALATVHDLQRYILYDTTFLENFNAISKNQWGAYFVLAHEIGHHLNGHDFSIQDRLQRWKQELEADRFAGNVLFRLGATLEETTAGFRAFSLEQETAMHPAQQIRLEAVSDGWKKASEISTSSGSALLLAAKNLYNLALAKKNLGLFSESIWYFDRALEYDPTFAEAYCNRGYLKNRLGLYSDALVDFNYAIKFEPDNPEAYFYRGVANKNLIRLVAALSDFDLALKLAEEENGADSSNLDRFLKANFPFPPPPCFQHLTLPANIFTRCSTFGQVAQNISKALATKKYPFRFMSVPDGFAVVTQIEQYRSDGSVLLGENRFKELPVQENFALTFSYLKSLVFPRKAYLRIFVFVVSSQNFNSKGERISKDAAREWFNEGVTRLPKIIADDSFSADHTVEMLVYEFEVPEADHQPEQHCPCHLSAAEHLKKSGLKGKFKH